MQRKDKELDCPGDNKNLINEGINRVYCQRCMSEELKHKVTIQKQLRK